MEKASIKRISKIDTLRAIAVLMVCFLHFTRPTQVFPDDHWIKEIGKYGKYGVEIFFIISGFVLPYSMDRSRYKVSRFLLFMRKRLIRIEIPYISAAILILLIGYLATLAPFYKGVKFEMNWPAFFGHFIYINHYNSWPWVSPVFWTLAIEFQFYMLIGILFPFIVHKTKWLRYIIYIILMCIYWFWIDGLHVFRFITFFIAGIETFLFFKKYISKREFVFAITSLVILTLFNNSWEGAASIVFFLLWFYIPFESPNWLKFIGKISFSLYMLHGVFGTKLQNLLYNFFPEPEEQLAILPLAYGVSIFGSYVFWRLIEFPAMKLSQKYRYAETR